MMLPVIVLGLVVSAALAAASATIIPTDDFSSAEPGEAFSGGDATSIEKLDNRVFSHPSANIGSDDFFNFSLGNALFRKIWVSSPSSTTASDGLGPLYNARSCDACHINDGRGHPPEAAGDTTSILVRLARGPENKAERQALADHLAMNFADPVYGAQLQDRAVPGLVAEGKIAVSYHDIPVMFNDGSVMNLRKPNYRIDGLSYGPLDPRITLSPRIAQPMIGLGLVEAIDADDIVKLADPEDANKDGISGRQQIALDQDHKPKLGRFGWKAEMASIRRQVAHAFAGDIGISTSLAPRPYGDCRPPQTACMSLSDGRARQGEQEATDQILDLVTAYSQNLAVPARRKSGFERVLAGKQLFYDVGCVGCHTPKFMTKPDSDKKHLASQLIWPYSDFLLHDMGEGLSDGQMVGQASGREWRTPPLWGIGLTATVGGQAFYLHDGRARSLDEAVLWHGGEANKARDAYIAMDRDDRQKLIEFLESL